MCYDNLIATPAYLWLQTKVLKDGKTLENESSNFLLSTLMKKNIYFHRKAQSNMSDLRI